MMKRQVYGFTLIELLTVVGVIAILAAIAVPNFLEAQTRSKIARAHSDLAVLSMGLDRYYAEHGAYPPNHPETALYLTTLRDYPIIDEKTTTTQLTVIPWLSNGKASWSYGMEIDDNEVFKGTQFPPLYYNTRQLDLLTTPVAYLETAIPVDVFGNYKQIRPFYINSYELFADDKKTSHPGLWGNHLTSETLTVMGSMGPDGELNFLHPVNGPWISYDPTNGTVSNGDILKFEGRELKHSPSPPNAMPPPVVYEEGELDQMLMML